VSKSLITLHEGTISVASEGEGHGCTFSVELPVHYTVDGSCCDEEAHVEQRIQFDMTNVGVLSNSNSEAAIDELRQEPGSGPGSGRGLGRCSGAWNGRVTDIAEGENRVMNISQEIDNGMHSSHDDVGEGAVCVQLDSGLSNSQYDGDDGDGIIGYSGTRRKPSVLLVDDASMIRKMMRRAHADKFSSIADAEDGDEAVATVTAALGRGESFDLILMDYQMPNLDGPSAAKVMREMGYKGLIVGLTGNLLPEDVAYFLSMGADRVLGKPVKEHEIERVLAMLSGAEHK